MPRKKPKVDTLEEIETNIKLLCDQSNNHMKVRAYEKALFGYNQAVPKVVTHMEGIVLGIHTAKRHDTWCLTPDM
ncbi:GM15664 [Drosophila sechellia]|uniref:GM15664 n=1 Tax=Drosophila sechellia TaxID=7238 RepID=B4I7Z7_DROSE|nr:GM15664 [Drosophila sechellia]